MSEIDNCELCEQAMGFYRWKFDKRFCEECFDSHMEWVEEQQKDID